jgi:hypothetical protein
MWEKGIEGSIQFSGEGNILASSFSACNSIFLNKHLVFKPARLLLFFNKMHFLHKS